MATDSTESQGSASDDDVLLLMTLRAVVELMGDDLYEPESAPQLPEQVDAFARSADPAELKQMLLLAASELAARLRGPSSE